MRLVVLSDTHGPRRWKGLPPGLFAPLAAADAVLHAGDVCRPFVLDELAAFAPVHVVLGNNDAADVAAWGATHTMEREFDGLRVGMIHDAGPKAGRAERLRRRFPEADLVVYGHSHRPVDDAGGAVHLFNPGSPTDPRREPAGTYGVLEVEGGRLLRHEIVALEASG